MVPVNSSALATASDEVGPDMKRMADAIRVLSMDAVEKAKSGHPGMPMGMADVATVLFSKFMRFDPQDAAWPDRDRFVLSTGHGSMLLYSLLYLTGYPEATIEELANFRQLGAKTAGHPEYGHLAGVEVTTGPLGQGLGAAVGMALGERMMAARFGEDLVDHYTYAIAGDGCLMEGVSHEAIDLAGHLRLSKLIVLFDDNEISIDGPTSLSTSVDQLKRFEAAGWSTRRVDGHDIAAVEQAIAEERKTDRPSLIACRTVIGRGAPNKQGTHGVHGAPLGADEIAAVREGLGWTDEPFVVPAEILDDWRAAGARGTGLHAEWKDRLAAAPDTMRQLFHQALELDFDTDLEDTIDAIKVRFAAEKPKLATRQSSQKVLEELVPALPWMIGGSADLTGSNGTRIASHRSVSADDFSGGYINYGVREHGMAAAMNGLALHGGFVPYGGTFLVFADYSRPSIRLAALMGVRVIHVMTHDSIGLGEDGPTHQPVEHLESLRAMPNVNVFRPADAVETAECWLSAIQNSTGPSVLCLTRQGLPTLRTEHLSENLTARGAYVLRDTEGERDVTLMASGSEVAIAVEAAERLAGEGIAAAVVSMPCIDLFKKQDRDYQEKILGTAPRIAVEAAVRDGWDRWLGPQGTFIGMQGFGASGPYEELYEHFGITPAAIVEAAKTYINIGKESE
ncbi:transketolase [Afifella sp. IM 167]|uniref:transketolase n=1 Tax=Afifella sp. IM 167 TaxID=2033586 RepID=UPI00351D8A56|nr:transketolase [Afifella sp. IM 167]